MNLVLTLRLLALANETVVAAKFARDCMKKMQEAVLKLEVTLGPDTAELDLRIGIHR